MKLLFTVRSCAKRRDMLAATLRSLKQRGVSKIVYVQHDDLTPNMNGVSQIDHLTDQDWIVMTEDDLEWCADPEGSIRRWLEEHARPDVTVYRFFAFDILTPYLPHCCKAPLREMKGSQAVALRAADARRFAAWARQHPLDWRPKQAPFQHEPYKGFDKLIGYWALQDRSDVPYGFVSTPFFVKHVGRDSSLYARAIHRDKQFGGTGWSYRAEVPA